MSRIKEFYLNNIDWGKEIELYRFETRRARSPIHKTRASVAPEHSETFTRISTKNANETKGMERGSERGIR